MRALEYILRVLNRNQNDFAKQLGVSAVTLNHWVAGRRYPTSEQLNQLVQLFGVPEEYYYRELTVKDRRLIDWYLFPDQRDDIETDYMNLKNNYSKILEELRSLKAESNRMKEGIEDFRKKFLKLP